MLNLSLSLTYAGWRNYTEIKYKGTKYGFAPGMTRTDIPEEFIRKEIVPSLKYDAKMWVVGGLEDPDDQTIAMQEVIKETPVEETTTPMQVNAPVVEADATAVSPDLSSLTRAKLMSLASKMGLKVSPSDKKIDLIERLQGE